MPTSINRPPLHVSQRISKTVLHESQKRSWRKVWGGGGGPPCPPLAGATVHVAFSQFFQQLVTDMLTDWEQPVRTHRGDNLLNSIVTTCLQACNSLRVFTCVYGPSYDLVRAKLNILFAKYRLPSIPVSSRCILFCLKNFKIKRT